MNAAEQLEISRRLDGAGVRFVKPVRDGAKIIGWEPIEWPAAIGRIMAAFGWRVELVHEGPPTDEKLEQAGQSILRLLP